MKIEQIREIAKQKGITPGKMKKVELIRTIQSTEGNPQCFLTEQKYSCGEHACWWKADCTRNP
jgi:hypothetical protein